jgi:hypothetical protein
VRWLLHYNDCRNADGNSVVDKVHIGGSDDLAAADRSGKLKKILAAAAKAP